MLMYVLSPNSQKSVIYILCGNLYENIYKKIKKEEKIKNMRS